MDRNLLDQLLKDSFEKYCILFNDLSFHIHNCHHLGSIYFMGATEKQMRETYEHICKNLDPYKKSPMVIDDSNWQSHLGDVDYCLSYRDYFHEKLAQAGNDWKNRLFTLLKEGENAPLFNSLLSGVAHPLIHLGYALELDSMVVGVETLALAAVAHNYLHTVMLNLEVPSSPSKSALTIFKEIHMDKDLPIYEKPGVQNLASTVNDYHDRIKFYYNQWNIDEKNPEKVVEELFDLSVLIYGAAHKDEQVEFDFFLLHLLTSMHAIRIIYPHLNEKRLFYHFFYFSIAIYIAQLRPQLNEKLIENYPLDANKGNWEYVYQKSLNTKIIQDAHAIKAIRSLHDGEEAFGKKDGFYLKTALKTVDNLNVDDLWVGGMMDERQLNVLKLTPVP